MRVLLFCLLIFLFSGCNIFGTSDRKALKQIIPNSTWYTQTNVTSSYAWDENIRRTIAIYLFDSLNTTVEFELKTLPCSHDHSVQSKLTGNYYIDGQSIKLSGFPNLWGIGFDKGKFKVNNSSNQKIKLINPSNSADYLPPTTIVLAHTCEQVQSMYDSVIVR